MSAPARRSLLPHEHGAYGQIALPLVCALALGRPGPAAALLAAGAFAGFLSYEPLLVAAGSRGARAREEDGPRARRLAAGLITAAVALAGAGFLLASPAARLSSAVPPALAAAIALLVRLELERTVAGEVAVAVALSSAGFPVAVASGVSPGAAAAAWLAWSLGFAATTFAVEVVLGRARAPARDPGPAAAAGVLLLQGTAVALAAAGVVPLAVPAAVGPMALASLAVILLRLPVRRLRVVGWTALAGSAAALVVLLAGLRR
jgi:hypothetical protein